MVGLIHSKDLAFASLKIVIKKKIKKKIICRVWFDHDELKTENIMRCMLISSVSLSLYYTESSTSSRESVVSVQGPVGRPADALRSACVSVCVLV
jgi:hypothetical protein